MERLRDFPITETVCDQLHDLELAPNLLRVTRSGEVPSLRLVNHSGEPAWIARGGHLLDAVFAVRSLTVLTLAAAVLAPTARGELQLPGLPALCLPQITLPLLACPASGTGSSEPRPGVVTPTTVRYDPNRVIVDFKRGTRARAINAAFARAGVLPERKVARIGLYLVAAPEGKRDQALTSLRRERSVEHVEREVVLDGLDTIPNDPAWPDQWGLRATGFPKAWDVTRGSSEVVVAVLDTGIDASHPDLRGATVPGRDIVNRDDDPADDNGHGTAVAGIIAARGNNGIGLAGACWACLVMPVKVLGRDGTGTTTDVSAGIIWAADHGARVINLSLGAPGTTDALSGAVAYATGKDVVVVASAGNSGSAIPFYPAADDAVIGVAASNPGDELYSWSNRGVWVLVAAPGCNDATWPGGEYVLFCGTSAAAPLVAGVAALVRSAKPGATAQETVDAVEKAVDQIPGEVRHGRINAGVAVSGLRLSESGTVRRTTIALRGRLGARVRARTYRRQAGAGPLVGTLRFGRARRLTLVLLRPGRQIVRVSGRSPLRLRKTVRAGPIKVVVKGSGARTSYRLTLSYAVR